MSWSSWSALRRVVIEHCKGKIEVISREELECIVEHEGYSFAQELDQLFSSVNTSSTGAMELDELLQGIDHEELLTQMESDGAPHEETPESAQQLPKELTRLNPKDTRWKKKFAEFLQGALERRVQEEIAEQRQTYIRAVEDHAEEMIATQQRYENQIEEFKQTLLDKEIEIQQLQEALRVSKADNGTTDSGNLPRIQDAFMQPAMTREPAKSGVAISAEHLAIACKDQKVYTWSLAAGPAKPLHTFKHSAHINDVDINKM